MKVVYIDEALRDLDQVLTFIERNYPTILGAFRRRLHTIGEPADGQRTHKKSNASPGVYIIPLNRCPYKVFYRVTNKTVEVLHIH
jgi:plasmid stabilization system protein ParE